VLSPRKSENKDNARTQRYNPDDSDEWMENKEEESE